jgi:hypothetical protein
MRYHPRTIGRLGLSPGPSTTKPGTATSASPAAPCARGDLCGRKPQQDGTVAHGYCLNPDCRHEPSEGLMHLAPLERRVTGGNWF